MCVETRGNWLKINIFNIERLVKMGHTSGSSNWSHCCSVVVTVAVVIIAAAAALILLK